MPIYFSNRLAALILITVSIFPVAGLLAEERPVTNDAPQDRNAPGAAAAAPPQATQAGIKTERTQEDFSSLTLAGSSLVAAEPVAGGHEENKDFVRDLFQLQWRANDPIDLYIIRPAGVKKPAAILYLFSYPSDTARFLNAEYCKRLVSNGAAAIGFASALTGERATHHPMKEWFVSELQESLGTTVHDVQMILNFLETRNDLDTTRIGMFGQGSGGAIAILAASADPRIKALDLIKPWGDWPDFLAEAKGIPEEERSNYLKPEFLKKLEPLEPIRYLPDLKTQSIRIEFTDDSSATKWAAHVEKAVPPRTEIQHYATNDDLRAASSSGKLFQWIADKQKPASATDAPAQGQPFAAVDKKGSSL